MNEVYRIDISFLLSKGEMASRVRNEGFTYYGEG
jgi:hypothetical protein